MADLLTSVEVAAIFRTDVRTVQRMAKTGRLPVAQKLPGATGPYLFSRDVVELIGRDGRPR